MPSSTIARPSVLKANFQQVRQITAKLTRLIQPKFGSNRTMAGSCRSNRQVHRPDEECIANLWPAEWATMINDTRCKCFWRARWPPLAGARIPADHPRANRPELSVWSLANAVIAICQLCKQATTHIFRTKLIDPNRCVGRDARR